MRNWLITRPTELTCYLKSRGDSYSNVTISPSKVVDATMPVIIKTILCSVKGRLYAIVVTRLLRLSLQSFSPSKVTLAFLRVKKTESKIREELKMKGIIERAKSTLRSERMTKEATDMPMANDPALPTKIFPRKLR